MPSLSRLPIVAVISSEGADVMEDISWLALRRAFSDKACRYTSELSNDNAFLKAISAVLKS